MNNPTHLFAINLTLTLAVISTSAYSAKVSEFYGSSISTYAREGNNFFSASSLSSSNIALPADIVEKHNGYVGIKIGEETVWLDELDVKIEWSDNAPSIKTNGCLKSQDGEMLSKIPSTSSEVNTAGSYGFGENGCP